MYFIAGRKDTQAILEIGGRDMDFSTSAIRIAFRAALCTNYAISDSNLSFYYLTDNDEKVLRIKSGDSYAVTWTAASPTGEINGLDFSTEDAKRWVKVTVSDAEILADNSDTTTITIELWKADKSGIATSVTTNADVPVLTPNGPRKVRVNLVNGVATKTFKTSIPGEWVIPSKTRFNNVRVWQSATVESIQPFADL